MPYYSDFSNNLALVTADENLTYKQLLDLGDEIVRDIPERSLLFLIATNTVAALAAYIGSLRKHIPVAMIREETTPEQFIALANAYEPQFIWAPEGFGGAAALSHASVVRECRGYNLLSTEMSPNPIHPDLALLITTSGSTGTPKYVRLSYGNIKANAESIAQYQQITSHDRAITTLPFSYSYGISIVNSHLLRGASIALTEASIMSKDFWGFLSESQATNFGGVPFTYTMLKRLRFGRMQVPSLRFISQAGGHLPEKLQAEFASICAEKGIDFFIMYGQTEATARMSWLEPSLAGIKIGSMGTAIPGGRFELHDVNDETISKPHQSGELVYYGPNVSLGYATGKEDLQLADENNGVLHTGDVAEFDEDGCFYIVGRMKRFLKMFGNRVNMDELERIFAQRNIEIACVGSDDSMVVFTTDEDPESVLTALSETTKLHPRGFSVRRIEEIPHTASGKTDYVRLSEQC